MSLLDELVGALSGIETDARAVSVELVRRGSTIDRTRDLIWQSASVSADPSLDVALAALDAAARSCVNAAERLTESADSARRYLTNLAGPASATGGSAGSVVTPLSNAQLEFIGAEFSTAVGSAFFYAWDPRFRAASNDVPAYPGEYVLDIHGTPDSVSLCDSDGNWTDLTVAEFATVVRGTGWDGSPIRLFACHTGAGSFAQDLADILGVPVTAPDRAVWSFADGRPPVVADPVTDIHGRTGPDPSGGSWQTFQPRSSRT
ncbi:hypothetical protein [Smaragdicoccus niigatensis]|uniref:hypothetical protein n=1 Tax=Smaragdicoccus niigatensis TaxID=359359 RepID=UPI0003656AC1|nr:hypothetical protein [Smaragdicoccus niigatensis]